MTVDCYLVHLACALLLSPDPSPEREALEDCLASACSRHDREPDSVTAVAKAALRLRPTYTDKDI